jgi:protein TonB
VLSGPAMLRQAAVDALRRWKYQPGTLNGTPVAVDITVTMSFHN